MKLLDEYQITGKDGRMATHYEYFLDTEMPGESYAKNFSLPATGIRMIEDYVSNIIGLRAVFYQIHACLFFPVTEMQERRCLTMDISISKKRRGKYSVSVDISDQRQVLIEVSGCMSVTGPLRNVSEK